MAARYRASSLPPPRIPRRGGRAEEDPHVTPLSCRSLRSENKPPLTRQLSPAPPLAPQTLAGGTLFKTAHKQACLLRGSSVVSSRN